jgi:hypothetical protein
MGTEPQPRLGILVALTGLGLVGLAVARLIIGPGPGPGGPVFAVSVGLTGAVMVLWGVRRLRRAKAARPGVSWWGLLRGELAVFAVAAALLPAGAAVPQGERDELMRAAREWFELVHAARGH